MPISPEYKPFSPEDPPREQWAECPLGYGKRVPKLPIPFTQPEFVLIQQARKAFYNHQFFRTRVEGGPERSFILSLIIPYGPGLQNRANAVARLRQTALNANQALESGEFTRGSRGDTVRQAVKEIKDALTPFLPPEGE